MARRRRRPSFRSQSRGISHIPTSASCRRRKIGPGSDVGFLLRSPKLDAPGGTLMDPFGTSGSRVRPDHALIAPTLRRAACRAGRGRAAWSRSRPGSGRSSCSPRLPGGGGSAGPPPRVERFVFILDGRSTSRRRRARPGARSRRLRLSASGRTRHAHVAGRESALHLREAVCGRPGTGPPAARSAPEADVRGSPSWGPRRQPQVLLPMSRPSTWPVQPVHLPPRCDAADGRGPRHEHGLLMLEGQGVYRLAGLVVSRREGDAVWMAPYCPQWSSRWARPGALPLLQ